MRTLSVARSLGAMVIAAGLVGFGGTVSAVAPAGIIGADAAAGVFQTGPIKGIVVGTRDGNDEVLRVSLQGLPTAGTLRLVGTSKGCAKPHTAGQRVLGYSIGATQTGSFATQGDIDGLFQQPVELLRSLRILKGGVQRACVRATTYGLGSTGASVAIELKNTLISSYIKAPGPKGLIMVGPLEDGKVSVAASLLRVKTGAAHRLVGSSAPCGQAHTSPQRVFQVAIPDAGDATAFFDIFATDDPWVKQGATQLRSIRLFRGTGTGNQVECRGIIAVLIGL